MVSRYYSKGKRISLRRVTEDDWAEAGAASHAMEVNPKEMWDEMFFSKRRNLYVKWQSYRHQRYGKGFADQ